MPQNKPDNMTAQTRPEPDLRALETSNFPPSDSVWQWRKAGLAVLALTLGFSVPLWNLLRYVTVEQSGALSSYILLIPFICGYLLWVKRGQMLSISAPPRKIAVVFLAVGFTVLAVYWLMLRSRLVSKEDVYLAIMMISFL